MSLVKSLFAAIWVGWQRDFGWTNPGGAILLRTVGPIATVLSVSIIYWLGSSFAGAFDSQHLAYIMVGAALYVHIAMYSSVSTFAIAEGKWTYVFAHVFMSPKSSVPYIAGRTVATFVTSALAAMISLTVAYLIGTALFHTFPPLIITPSSSLMLLVALVLNIPATMGLGFLLGAYSIYASKFEWALPTYVQGILMLVSGALFPVSVLPWPVSSIADVLPFTLFIRAARYALVFGDSAAYAYSLALALVGGIVLLAIGLGTYKLAEMSGRRKGIIDKKVV